MGSLLMLGLAMFLSYGFMAWALVWAARKVGSTRARLRFATLATLLMFALTIALSLMERFVNWGSPLTAGVISLLIQLGVIPVILQEVFDLRVKASLRMFLVVIAATAIQLLFAVFVLKRHFTEAFVMPTLSMSPTIEPHDRFLANKLLHPRRWDLVTYWNVSKREPDPQAYVKRLVGMPGERLRFEGGDLYVNDRAVQAPAVLAGRLRASPTGMKDYDWQYSDGETITLGPDEFFLVGDDIGISADSRIYGPSKASALIGVVDAIYWPPKRMKLLR